MNDQNPDQTETNQPNDTNQEITELKEQLDQMTNTAKRAMADLKNLKKRTSNERVQIYPQAQADLMLKLLPVINNLHRATSSTPTDLKEHDWVQGINQIEQQLDQILNQLGFEEINPAGQKFDPNEHEAMLETDGPSNQVVEVLEKGYKMKDKVIRPAKVSVGKG